MILSESRGSGGWGCAEARWPRRTPDRQAPVVHWSGGSGPCRWPVGVPRGSRPRLRDVVRTARGHQCFQVDILVGLARRVGSAVNPRGAVHDAINTRPRQTRLQCCFSSVPARIRNVATGSGTSHRARLADRDRWHMHHRFKKLAGALAAIGLTGGLTWPGPVPRTRLCSHRTARGWRSSPRRSTPTGLAYALMTRVADRAVPEPATVALPRLRLRWHRSAGVLDSWHQLCGADVSDRQHWRLELVHWAGRAHDCYHPVRSVGGQEHSPRILRHRDWQRGGMNVLPATQSPDPNNQVMIVSTDTPAGQQPYCVAANTFLDQNGNRLIANRAIRTTHRSGSPSPSPARCARAAE